MSMQSVFSSPNPILFGLGTSEQAGQRLRRLGCTKVLVVCDMGIQKAGIAEKIISNITASGIKTVCYDGVVADVADWSVEEAGALGAEEKVDGVVGIGGGSSLDTAKGAKLLLTNPPPITQYFRHESIIETKPSFPLVLIPTTAGMGSEATLSAVITDTKHGTKSSVGGAGCKVDLGIVDPELTLNLPPAVTASTGMDTLCHAAEAYTSAMPNSFTDVLAREAISLIGKYLVRAFENGHDIEAREGMMKAATLGGMALAGPLYHISHDIGKVMGAKFHVVHGNACASCLPQVLETVAPAVADRVRFIAEAFGASIPENAEPEQIGKAACQAIKTLMKRLKLPNLSELDLIKEDLIKVIPHGVVVAQNTWITLFGGPTCPIPVTKELIADIISRAYDEN